MEPHERYQIADTIAKGDFATVFRAHDLELDRDVAVKQIHQQYLDDPSQLEQYWQEAQLLASLQHPFIMSIHDIVRQRGWLILELMQGNLQDRLAGEPCDLDYLRLTMTYVLHSLNFLEKNGIVHGDVKPTNLLLDKQNRVKLGDFGIARRITGDDGSLVKGTTKYMAPEVIADQFGEVGPHSDLYSLGFSAFELMCGSGFESLFPGLNMFGRDQQVAWMMWHTAADRRLPKIHTVLEGVPEDLAFIIEKLTEKDPANRYRHAEEALADLRAKTLPTEGPTSDETQADEEDAKRTRRKRLLAIAALAASLVLSVGLALLPLGGQREEERKVDTALSRGTISEIDARKNQLILRPHGEKPLTRIIINPGVDHISLNGQRVDLKKLEKGDEITVERVTQADGKTRQDITASRSTAVQAAGKIVAVRPSDRLLTMKIDDGSEQGKTLLIYVPSTVELRLNEEVTIDQRPVRLADLRVDDRIVAQYVSDKDSLEATSVDVLRSFPLDGYLISVDAGNKRLTMRTGRETDAPQKVFSLAPDCAIFLNGVNIIDGKVLTLGHLQADDKIRIRHDTKVSRIDAYRQLTASGVVDSVVDSVDGAQGQIVVTLTGRTAPTEFAVGPDCPLKLLGSETPVDLAFVRPGDQVTITHSSPDLKDAEAASVEVAAQPDRRTWAIVVGLQEYDDNQLSKLQYTAADAELIRDTLLKKYRVPEDQLLSQSDPSRRRLEQQIPDFLPRVEAGSQLIVYFTGHAYLDDSAIAYLAPKEFDPTRMAASGLPLRWLVRQMENCPAGEKILLLDTCHQGAGRYIESQPSSAELAASLIDGPTRPVSTSVTVLASCIAGQRGRTLEDESHGVFAHVAAAALCGQADDNGDHRVDADELFSFLEVKMSQLADTRRPQTPFRYLPDATPARLSPEGKEAMRGLLAYLQHTQLDDEGLATLGVKLEDAMALAPKQPDPRLAYGLVLLKHGKTMSSLRTFEEVTANHPDAVLAHQALAWQHYNRKNYVDGIKSLARLVEAIKEPQPGRQYDPYSAYVLQWAGALREFALKAAEPALSRDEVRVFDQAVVGRQGRIISFCQEGVEAVRRKVAALDEKIRSASSEKKKAALLRERRRLGTFVQFDFGKAEQFIRSGLDR